MMCDRNLLGLDLHWGPLSRCFVALFFRSPDRRDPLARASKMPVLQAAERGFPAKLPTAS